MYEVSSLFCVLFWCFFASCVFLVRCFFFFFNDTATTEIYTLSLHDALPIFITRPGAKNWSGNASTQLRSDAMNARNAFATTDTPEQNRQFNFGLRGPLGGNRTSIRFNVDGRRDTQGDTIVALDPSG